MKLSKPEAVLYFKEDTIIGLHKVPKGSLFRYSSPNIGVIVGKYFYPNGRVSNEVRIKGDILSKKKDKIIFLPELRVNCPIGTNDKYIFKGYELDGASFCPGGDVIVIIPYEKLYYFLYSNNGI